jgi:hypothetical protein
MPYFGSKWLKYNGIGDNGLAVYAPIWECVQHMHIHRSAHCLQSQQIVTLQLYWVAMMVIPVSLPK